MEEKEKLALVIEGGGFKSVFSAGVLDAFLMNKFNPFDIYIGVSSGAMCLSYYVANQYKAYFSLSKEVSINKKFLSYRHALSEQGYMDLNFLSKYAKEHNPLDLQNIKESTENKELYIVATNLENQGVTIHHNASLLRLEKKGSGVEYELEYKDGRKEVIQVEKALLSVGRVPNIESLGIDNAGVTMSKRGIHIGDEDTRTNIPNIYNSMYYFIWLLLLSFA